MVSVHDTRSYHNYTYQFDETNFIVNKNTILSYLEENEPSIFNIVTNNDIIKHKLNNLSYNYTIFIPVNMNQSYNLEDHLYESKIILSNKNLQIVNIKKNIQSIVNEKKYLNFEIIIPNISVNNGIIHLIKI